MRTLAIVFLTSAFFILSAKLAGHLLAQSLIWSFTRNKKK